MENDYGFLGAILLFFLAILVMVMVGSIIVVIAKWKLLKKAGEEGWKAIIPIYGDIVFCEITGVCQFYPIVLFVISLVSSNFGDSNITKIVSLLYSALYLYFAVILNISVAKSYGKDTGFGIGLLLLGFVFYPMLAFGNSQYVGKNPINDPLVNSFSKNQKNSTDQSDSTPKTDSATSESTEEQHHGNYCPECGTPNPENASFCKNCGNKLK